MVTTVENANKAMVMLQRFGLGPKAGGVARFAPNPLGSLKRELNNPDLALLKSTTLPTYADATFKSADNFNNADVIMQAEIRARIKKQMSVGIGFLERLVAFWSNHFSMSVNKSEIIRGTLGQLERDVIRPNILGKFSTMLRGVIQHPAMIAYLDNTESIGPNSVAGKNWNAGLNENLAREILELHTVGSGGGYSETDVTQFARIITGWSYVRGWEADGHYNGGKKANRGRFIFRPDWHEPGTVKLMGRSYPNTGMSQGLKVLNWLAVHPKTAEHIAFKLILHFITDTPTPTQVKAVADAFLSSGGDLKETALALISLPEALTAPLTKLRTPQEATIAQYRVLGKMFKPDQNWLYSEPLRAMNNMTWQRGTPDGFPDESYFWLRPDGMRIRLDTSYMTVGMLGDQNGPTALSIARSHYDKALSATTAKKIAAAADKRAGLTIFFMSPEFQRR